jgi:hypothetical protein
MDVSAMSSPLSAGGPWYRQRWPWLLFGGPAVVVVAGIVTAWIAASSDDGLVAEDYYKRGLLINQDLERVRRAEALRVGAVLRVTPDAALAVELTGSRDAAPATLRLLLAHPTRSGEDLALTLPRGGDGVYRGRLPAARAGRWIVTVEGEGWRLQTAAAVSSLDEVRLGSARVEN